MCRAKAGSSIIYTSEEIYKNDILFTGSGETADEIGKASAYIFEVKAYAGGDIIIMRPSNGDSVFISYFLNSDSGRKQRRMLGQGHSVVHIYPNSLKLKWRSFDSHHLSSTS